MTAQPDRDAFVLDDFLLRQERKGLLRIVSCGAVDDGKSTLMGRLLYEAKSLFDDQLAALEADSRRHGARDIPLDYSLLLDGLSAEREQGITIDVAYRFFSTERRKFIVADTPGHEQYTRNMATGASTADLAVILVDARRGMTRQTRRHSLVLSMLGVDRVVLVVNKMDLVDWSEAAFRAIEVEYCAFASALGFKETVCIPASARAGDNVAVRSRNMEWYRGPTLLRHLEEVEIEAADTRPFRMPVQSVIRPNSDFRGYAGLIAAGEMHPGMPVCVLPSGLKSRVARIVTHDGDLERGVAGQSVTVVLTDEIDISRGDVIAEVGRPPFVGERFRARLFWIGAEPFASGKSYFLKLGTQIAAAALESTVETFDLDTLASSTAERLDLNGIADCTLQLDRPLVFDRYADNRETGGFILIDRESHDTVGIGLVAGGEAKPSGAEPLRLAHAREDAAAAPLAGEG
jgi:sulfate adenylyltransferase large subunit